jgi:hypothetical protein
MAQQEINVGTAPNNGQGDPIRDAFEKCNNNFTELYNRVQTTAPVSPEGSDGDSAGMIAWDATYLYVCVAEYDASTPIWQRVVFDTTPW